MKFNSAPYRWRISAILFSLSLLLSACAEAPKDGAPGTTAGSSNASAPPASSGVAVGHGSDASSSTPATVPMQAGVASGEVTWTAPPRWEAKPASGMRRATYLIPAAAGDQEGAECAVFTNIAGGVDANIKRWLGQFEQPDGSSSEAKAKQKTETINGLSVTSVDLTGTFAGGGMAMGQPSVKKTGYRLLGAIVESPQGDIFFKMTGPAKTMAAAQAEFQTLLKSLKK